MDPIVGRDEEIRQIIDVLSRRRQNNPILTGEAGVGKTAVVEGFAQRIAAGDVPPPLRGVRLLALDIGLMQAGASLKGEFEQRLRSVIDEVQASPTPIILFIDEAHTLIGAGGAQGTGDAANLLKPALARGTLRTVGGDDLGGIPAIYRKRPGADPPLPACAGGGAGHREMLLHAARHPRADGKAPWRAHFRCGACGRCATCRRAIFPRRQLPDKAVSLLDTACARVAISQSTTPAAIADIKVAIETAQKELDALGNEGELGGGAPERVAELAEILAARNASLADREAAFLKEKAIVDEVIAARRALARKTLRRKYRRRAGELRTAG